MASDLPVEEQRLREFILEGSPFVEDARNGGHQHHRANSIVSPLHRHSTREDADEEESIATLKPDGGWGWVVVFASFAIQIIADGVANAHGIIFVELLKVFGESKSKTAWVGSVFSGIPLISGPIASALAEQYGCRPITILGGILSSVGFGLSVLATSIDALCITMGLISGFGLSLVYVTSMFILVRWFDNKLSFTMGISSAGSGIGMFIFAPFVTYLLETYELSGTLLILSGVFLNIVVFGALMREPEEMGFGSSRSCNASDSDSDSESDSKSTWSAEEVHNMRRCVSLIEVPTYFRQDSVDRGMPTFPQTGSTDNMLVPRPSIAQTSQQAPASALKNVTSPSIHPLLPVEKKKRVRFDKPPPPLPRRMVDRRRSYLFGQHHVINWKRYGFHVPLRLAAMESLSCPDLTSEVDLSQDEEEEESGKLRCFLKPLRRELRQIRRLLFNVKPLRSPKFVLFCLANLILYLVVDIPCDFASDNAITQGVDFQKASFLLSIIGIVTTIGQPIYGYLGDREWCNSLVLFAVSTLVCGVLTVFVPFFITYEALAAYSGLFGFFISGSNPLFAVILVDIVDEKYFSSAFGLLYFAQGIATLFGPPMAGFLFDLTSNYDMTFYTAGAGMILASLILLLFPLVKYLRRRYRDRKIQVNVNVTIERVTASALNFSRPVSNDSLHMLENGNASAVHKAVPSSLESTVGRHSIPHVVAVGDHEGLLTSPSEHHITPHAHHGHHSPSHGVVVGHHVLPAGETAPVHVGSHLLAPIREDDDVIDAC